MEKLLNKAFHWILLLYILYIFYILYLLSEILNFYRTLQVTSFGGITWCLTPKVLDDLESDPAASISLVLVALWSWGF